MVSALVRILYIVCGASPTFYGAVWRKGKRKQVQEDDRNSLLDASDQSLSESGNYSNYNESLSATSNNSRSSYKSYKHIGLNIKTCVSEYRLAWFPRDIVK